MRELTAIYTALKNGTVPGPAGNADPVRGFRGLAARGACKERRSKRRPPSGAPGWRASRRWNCPACGHCLASARQRSEGGTFSFELPAALSASLRGLAQREGITLFMTLLAGWQAFLARFTGQTDIAVGSPISHRSRTETEGLIGLFLNTLVLRTDLSHNPTVREILRRVRGTILEAFAHQDLPFEMMMEDVHSAAPPGPEPAPARHVHPHVRRRENLDLPRSRSLSRCRWRKRKRSST